MSTRAADRDVLRRGTPGQVVVVLALGADLGGLLLGAGAELDVEPAASEQHGHRGAPAPGADHRGLAQRRQPAEPLPLELDVRPDPAGDGRGERRATDARSAGTSSGCPTRSFTLRGRIRQPRRTCSTAVHRDRDDRGAGLQRQPSDAAPRRPERAATGCGCPRGRCTTVPPRSRTTPAVSIAISSDCPRRIGNAPTRERIHPCQRRSKSSTLATYCIGRRHGRSRADHEGVEEAAVVGGDDQPALDAPEVLAAGPGEAEPDQERRAGGSGARRGRSAS